MGRIVEIAAKVTCVALLLFQGGLLNAYLSRMHDEKWWAWFIADGFVAVIWAASLVIAQRSFAQRGRDYVDSTDPTKYPDEIKYAFIAWIAYASLLSPRVAILFHLHAPNLEESDFLGPNFLKVAIASTPLVFLLMIFGFHNAKIGTKRKLYISSLAATVTLDLFDSMDLLELLFEPKNIPRQFLTAMLVFACINFFLPTLALYELRVNNFEGRVTSPSFKLLYVGSYVFLVNLPNLVIRSIIWHRYDADVSVLIMKNVMCIVIGFNDMFEFMVEERPKRCPKCQECYKRSFFKKHLERCARAVTERSCLSDDEVM